MQVSPFLPRILEILIRKAEPDADLHETIAETLGQISLHTVNNSQVSFGERVSLFEMILGGIKRLLADRSKVARSAGSLCLSKVIPKTHRSVLTAAAKESGRTLIGECIEATLQCVSSSIQVQPTTLKSIGVIIDCDEEEFAHSVQQFIPELLRIINSQNQDAASKKHCIDVLNKIIDTYPDQIQASSKEIFKTLAPLKSAPSDMLQVRKVSLSTIKLLRQKSPDCDSRNSHLARSSKGLTMSRKSPEIGTVRASRKSPNRVYYSG